MPAMELTNSQLTEEEIKRQKNERLINVKKFPAKGGHGTEFTAFLDLILSGGSRVGSS
jgi:hypothetical protein